MRIFVRRWHVFFKLPVPAIETKDTYVHQETSYGKMFIAIAVAMVCIEMDGDGGSVYGQ